MPGNFLKWDLGSAEDVRNVDFTAATFVRHREARDHSIIRLLEIKIAFIQQIPVKREVKDWGICNLGMSSWNFWIIHFISPFGAKSWLQKGTKIVTPQG